MNLKQLEAFVTVAETKNFSTAAKKLYLTQPTISAHIHSLEKELGSQLFIRTTKEVMLLEDGERLYHYAKQMIQLENNIKKEFLYKDRNFTQKIVVGASTVPGQYLLPQILSLFSRTYQGYQIELKEADSERVIEMVATGIIEIGFTGMKTEEPQCVFEAFYADKLMVITPNYERYARYLSTGFPLEQLCSERMILREEGSGTRKETERYLQDMGMDLPALNIVATISNQEAIKKAVSSGMGISIISKAVVKDYVRQGNLLCFPLEKGVIYRNLYMVWNKNTKPGPSARVFIQFVKEMYKHL